MSEEELQPESLPGKHYVLAVLLEKIQHDPFPSPTHMDLAEQLLTPETLPVYMGVIAEKIRNDPFPSLDMMNRLVELAP